MGVHTLNPLTSRLYQYNTSSKQIMHPPETHERKPFPLTISHNPRGTPRFRALLHTPQRRGPHPRGCSTDMPSLWAMATAGLAILIPLGCDNKHSRSSSLRPSDDAPSSILRPSDDAPSSSLRLSDGAPSSISQSPGRARFLRPTPKCLCSRQRCRSHPVRSIWLNRHRLSPHKPRSPHNIPHRLKLFSHLSIRPSCRDSPH